jgi:hypothetical protein
MGKVYCQPTPSTLSKLKFSTIFGSVQVTNGTPCEATHSFDIIGVSHPVSKRTHTGTFCLSRKLANMYTVGLAPVFCSGGSCCFVCFGSGWGALATALCFRYFRVETIMHCLTPHIRPQWVVVFISSVTEVRMNLIKFEDMLATLRCLMTSIFPVLNSSSGTLS